VPKAAAVPTPSPVAESTIFATPSVSANLPTFRPGGIPVASNGLSVEEEFGCEACQ